MLHARVGEKFSPRREAFSLSENSRKLSFAYARVVTQARSLAQARAGWPNRQSLA